jgi:hypothetical protein
MSGPKNMHEKQMGRICGRLMASPFLFYPDEWILRPRKRREPADLVWACNNCVILMKLKESKVYEKEEKNERTFETDAEDNLGQAHGRLEDWKTRPIEGRNEWHRFWLSRNPDTRVIVLSIVKTGRETFSKSIGNSFIEIHPEWAKERGVCLCATVPQFVIDHLAGMGGSTLDLLGILKGISLGWDLRHENVIHEGMVHKILRQYYETSIRMRENLNLATYALPASDNQLIAESAVVGLNLSQIRHQPTAKRGEEAPTVTTENVGAKYGILSDVDLGEFYCLSKYVAACVRLMRTSRQPVSRNLELVRYDCRVCAVPSCTHDDLCKEDFKVWAAPRRECRMRSGIYIRYIAESGALACWPIARFGPSYTEMILDVPKPEKPAVSS